MWFHRLFGSASCRFFEFFEGMLFENARGGGGGGGGGGGHV